MSPEGRWVAAALLVTWLHASCADSAEVEGAKWKPDLQAGTPKFSLPSTSEIADKWEEVTVVLEKAKLNATFPGCVAAVGNRSGFMYTQSLGSFTYGEPAPVTHTNPSMSTDTQFDLASLTKVLATTTACMILYQRGHLDLGDGKFGCPQTADYHPEEDFTCQEKIYNSLLTQTLEYSPGSRYLYSDLSMISLMYVVGTLARDLGYVQSSDLNMQCVHHRPNSSHSVPYYTQCYYEAFVRVHIVDYLGLKHMQFLPPKQTWADIAPTWNDSVYRHQVMQGYVSDGNSYALGGISGHAGLFSGVGDIFTLLHRLMFAGSTDTWINATTVTTFTTVYNTTQSSRALGWDTNSYKVKPTDSRLCGGLSSSTFTHTGYTGTQVCCDPVRKIITILLTNRCYKNDSTRSKQLILLTRRLFNDAVVHVLH
jgi:hypothetical protein